MQSLQRRDILFQQGDTRRFKKPSCSKFDGSQIRDGDTVLTDSSDVLSSWESYFCALGRSRLPDTPSIIHLEEDITRMAARSHLNNDDTLDWDITVDEIEVSRWPEGRTHPQRWPLYDFMVKAYLQ